MQCTSCGMNIQIGEAKCSSCGTPVQPDTSDFSPYLPADDAIPYIPYSSSTTLPAAAYTSQQSHTAQSLPDHSLQISSETAPQPQSAQQGPPERPHHPVYTVLLLITLVLLVIMGSGTTYYAAAFHPAELNARATAVVQSVLMAQTQATATANAGSPQGIYNQITSRSPSLADPLDGQHIGLWGNQRKGDTSCAFINGAYHIRISANDFFYYCLASSNDFSHFVFQVQVTIIKGFDAGIMFRSFNPQLIYYFFTFSYNGLYEFGSSRDLQGGGSVLAFGRSSAIKMGLNQPNLFSIMVRNSNLDLFINKQLVKSWQAESQGGGAIGLTADNTMHALTDTAFSNAQVWKLP
jgi:hypothetical protein